MTLSIKPTRVRHAIQGGFTVLELLFVVVIIGLLAAVALPVYQGYVARSQAAELALKLDAVRTGIQVAAKSGEVQANCAALAGALQSANLRSNYAQLALNFEPVAKGFTPVLTICATRAAHGAQAVEVTREAHTLLSRNSVISQGAVVGDSAVSFSVRLSGDTALCRALPPDAGYQGTCTAVTTPNNQSGTSTPPPVKPPQQPASSPVPAVSAPMPTVSSPVSDVSPPKPVALMPVPAASAPMPTASLGICRARPTQLVDRPVISLGQSGRGYITSTAPIPTGGNLRSFTAEVAIAGGQAPNNNVGAATLMSYYIAGSGPVPSSELRLWNPSSLHITFPGSRGVAEFDTGVNVDNGKSHRVTMSWQASDGALVLYDNGRAVWRQTGVNTNGVLPGNGQLVVGHGAPLGTEYGFLNGYRGSIANVALANKAITADQAASAPLHTVLKPNSGLLTDMQIGPYSLPFDTTSNTRYAARGSDFITQNMPIDPTVYVDENCL